MLCYWELAECYSFGIIYHNKFKNSSIMCTNTPKYCGQTCGHVCVTCPCGLISHASDQICRKQLKNRKISSR